MAISEKVLSLGVLDLIMNGVEIDYNPVFQILGTKQIAGHATERFRLLLSDGKYLNTFAMLASQLNELHHNGKLSANTVVRVDRYITSMVNKHEKGEKKVFIILEMTVLHDGHDVGCKLGNPKPWSLEISPTANNPAGGRSTVPLSSNTVNQQQRPTGSAPRVQQQTTSYNMNQSMNSTLNVNMVHPIASLSPYQNKWVIKARVISKSNVRTWSNAKGEGKLFSMDLMDESGEIRATAFKEQCDRYYDMIEADKIYFISKCQLKPANKQFSQLNNDYEMTFTSDTLVQPCEDDDEANVPQVKYNFVEISEIGNLEPKAVVDVIGICKETSELQQFTGRQNNREYKKRELTLIDGSNTAIQLTLWGDDAVNFDGHVQPVVLVKGGRITEFGGGKSVSMGAGSVLKINPDIPEGHQLRGWFDNGGGDVITTNVSARTGAGGNFSADFLTFHEARIQNLGAGDKADYFQTKSVIHLIRTNNAFYKACAQPECNKKVIEDGMGNYTCEKCNQTGPEFKYRLLINMNIGDWTSSKWVTCFNEVAEFLLGKTAEEVGRELESNDESAAEKLFSAMNFRSFIFKLRTKMEVFGDVHRNKMTVVSASPVNYKEYNQYLVKNLNRMLGIEKKQ